MHIEAYNISNLNVGWHLLQVDQLSRNGRHQFFRNSVAAFDVENCERGEARNQLMQAIV